MQNEIVVPQWNFKCPICFSSDLVRTKGTVGDWVKEYECQGCKSLIEYNEGDKMGGQFDVITILKDTTQPTETTPKT